jgi:hypothetical protein
MRPHDVIQIAKLHLEATVRLGELLPQSGAVRESDWTEEDDAEIDRIFGEIESEREGEEDSEEGKEDSEDGEDGQD